MAHTHHPLAVVTAASSGIGLQLAHQCAGAGFDLVIVANRPLGFAMKVLTDRGAAVEVIEADLSTTRGVDALLARLVDRRVDALLANAGACQDEITSTLYLVRSIASSMPVSFEATYGMKAVIDTFFRTLRKELDDKGRTSGSKVDLVDVARIGFTAMTNGEGEVVQYPPAPQQDPPL